MDSTTGKPPLKVLPDIPDALLQKYLSCDLVAVDTEMDGLQLRRDQVRLVQLCDPEGNVALVRPNPPKAPPNLKKLLTTRSVTKVFHYALADVTFLRASLGIRVAPFVCTKVMSKLSRTYTEQHSLKTLTLEFLGIDLSKTNQTSNWSGDLTPEQLEYAANDAIYTMKVFNALKTLVEARGKMPSGITLKQLNDKAQAMLPVMVELVLNGYGDRDRGWESSLFSH